MDCIPIELIGNHRWGCISDDIRDLKLGYINEDIRDLRWVYMSEEIRDIRWTACIIELIRDLKWGCLSDYNLHIHITLVCKFRCRPCTI